MSYEAPPRVPLQQVVRPLRCELTAEELATKSQALAESLHVQSERLLDHKARKADMRDLEKLDAEQVARLGEDVRTSSEERTVECEYIADFELAQRQLVRLDTGEVVWHEPLTDEYRQLAMKIAGAEVAPEALRAVPPGA